MDDIVNLLVPTALAMLGGLIVYALTKLEKFVEKTDNKWDDRALQTVKDAFAEVLAEGPAPKPAAKAKK